MTVEQTTVVDAIGVEIGSGRVVLTIADHLPFRENKEHLFLLQEKLNSYISFIESGELAEAYPDAKGRRPLVSVVLKNEPSAEAGHFLDEAQRVMAGIGIPLVWSLFGAEEEKKT